MSNFLRLSALFALLASLLGGTLTSTPVHAAGVLFAKPAPTGSGNCTSWANACALQNAITNSVIGDQIWVQKGTYKPHTSDRAVSFTLKNGVAIYGGFAGTETQLNQRNFVVNVTILSADLAGNDNGFTNNDENSYHVVVGSNTNSSTILDGFTITGGNANGASLPVYTGGGMYNSYGYPTLTNITFMGNSASTAGGGMYNGSSSPTLTNVTFMENSANNGGGMRNNNGSSPTLTNVTFVENSSFAGAGMFNFGGTPTLTNVTFSGNSASTGGGMYNTISSPILTNVTFSGNSAQYGGGLVSNSNSSLTLINTLIAKSLRGGDCVNDSSILNAISSNNLIEDASSACGLTNGVNGNIVGADPKLGQLANNGGPTKTHALLTGSPAINAGKDADCPTTDQRGVTRPWGIHCDIGSYEFAIRTITGNAGMAGVTLSFIDGTPQTVISQSTGNYSLIVSNGWSGTVTPSHPCSTFDPRSWNYTNVTADQTSQNYSAMLNPASGCTGVTVKLGQVIQGMYGIPKNSGARLSFKVESGPVFINGTNNVPFVASERVIFLKGSSTPTNFSEMMGLPANLRSTKYYFPVYDNLAFDSQLRFANVGTASTTVTVTIAGIVRSRDTLAPNQGMKRNYLESNGVGVSRGPVVVESTGGIPIIVSLRVVPRPYNGSFSEMMGLPQSQVGTSYIFPYYNNVTLDTQLRVTNVGTGTTMVTVTVAGVAIPGGTFTIGLNEPKRIRFANINNGPVRVTSSPGNIVASLRILPKNSRESFSEVMGLPQSQLDTTFVFPWYNNVTLDTQLRFANMSNTTATVRVFIGGQEMAGSPFTLAAGASTRKSFAVNNGPVRIVSNRNIVASLRVLPKNSTIGFSELMGLPQHQLHTAYIFPWYNNVGLDTQLRLGVP